MQEQTSIKIQGLTVGDRKVYQQIFDTFYHSLCLFTHRFIHALDVVRIDVADATCKWNTIKYDQWVIAGCQGTCTTEP